LTRTLTRLKAGYYLLTALGTIGASFYFNYLFFFLQDRFGFGDRENLGVAAAYGAVYTAAAWPCSRFAERRGFHTSLLVGFAALTVLMVAGGLVPTAGLHLVVMALYSLSLLFVWPALEAVTTEHEPPARIPHMVGVYNCTWSAALACAYFAGGSVYDWSAAGAVFWLPAALFAAAFALTWRLKVAAARLVLPPIGPAAGPPHLDGLDVRTPVSPRIFLRLAWIANPFSYVAIYTLFAVMPGLATRLGLSPARVGLFCSVWLFGRLLAFVGLWHWTGWHYRFDWLVGSYIVLTITFVGMLLAPELWMMVLAQVFFGLACGLIYYSSLFYSMDVGAAKAEHGGLHEGAIGAGVFAGPAIGALSISAFPGHPHANAAAVTGLLIAGLGVLVLVRWRASAGRHARRRPA
jgi:predicted MFS family arabinose efflux permease